MAKKLTMHSVWILMKCTAYPFSSDDSKISDSYALLHDDIIDGAVLAFQRKKHAHATWPELYQSSNHVVFLYHQSSASVSSTLAPASHAEFINLFGCGGTLFQAGCLAIQKLITYVCMVVTTEQDPLDKRGTSARCGCSISHEHTKV